MKQKLLLTLVMWLSLMGSTWAQSNALHFNSGTNKVNLGTFAASSPDFSQGFTFAAWVKFDAFSDLARVFTFATSTTSSANNLMLAASGTTGLLTAEVNVNKITTTQAIQTNKWYFLTFTVTSGGVATIYVNGVSYASKTYSAPVNVSRSICYLGNSNYNESKGLNGSMDEVSVWSRALSASEINAIMNDISIPSSQSGLIAYYQFNQGTAGGSNSGITSLTDATTNAKNGTLSGFSLTGTTSNWVTGHLPDPTITFTSTNSGNLSFIAKVTTAGKVYVDWGNGTLVPFDVTTSETTLSTTAYTSGNTVKVYGENISYLQIYGKALTSLDVSKATALTDLNCWKNSLSTLDVSKNTALQYLLCSYNSLSSLDVSKNTALKELRFNGNNISSLDVTNNSALLELECTSNALSSLDVSKNTALQYLDFDYNHISTLDVTHNTALQYLDCGNNNLSALDVSKNTALKTLKCYYNNLSLSTLPQPNSAYTTYNYAPQNRLSTASTNGVVDLSSQRTAVDKTGNTQTTTYTWYDGNDQAISTSLYTENNGVFTFPAGITSALHCQMTNEAFSDFSGTSALRTVDILEGLASEISFVSQNSGSLSLQLLSSIDSKVTVDWGNGTPVEYSASANSYVTISTTGYTAGSTVKISGKNIIYLYISNKGLTALDVSKNTALQILYCSSNNLTTLDVSQNTALQNLYCYSNKLTTLDVSKNIALTQLCCQTNKLETLDVSKNTALTVLACQYNNLSFAGLPQIKATYTTYNYYPQNQLAATSTNGVVDLSAQRTAVDKDGNTQATTYTWYYATDAAVPTSLYSESNGVFTFPTGIASAVYCTMTNVAFSSLSLRTVDLTEDIASEMSFVSQNSGSLSFQLLSSIDSKVTVDWGDGNPVENSLTANSYVTISTTGYTAGNTVKISGKNIYYLYISNKGLTILDVSKNTALQTLYCTNNNLSTLDVSKNTALQNLYCYSNKLTTLDVNKNIALTQLCCQTNKLEVLDVSKNTALTVLACQYNNLSFASLPQVKSTYTTYNYYPQNKLAATCTNGVIDLSAQRTAVDKDGNTQTTTYTCYNTGGTQLVQDADYIVSNGKIYFLKMPASTVYCTMANTAFPNFTGDNILRTVDFTVDAVTTTSIWTGASDTNWSNTSNWSNNTVPDATTDVVIPKVTNLPVIGIYIPASCNNLSINSDASLTIAASAAGTGSLIVHGTSTGNVSIQNYLTGTQWHIIAPEADGSVISSFLTNTNNAIAFKDVSGTTTYGMADYNEALNNWKDYFTLNNVGLNTFSSGKGYSVRRSSDGIITLTGILTTGTKNVTLTKTGAEGWNCIGNPYTSAIDINSTSSASSFLYYNTVTNNILDSNYGAIYLWDPSSSQYKVICNSGFDFPGERILSSQMYVAPGQGFFVKAASNNATVTFTPDMQSHQNSTTAAFLKSSKISWPAIRINVVNNSDITSTIVAFNSAMTKGLDPTYDAGLLRGSTGLNLYSRLVNDNGVEFAVQCLPEAYDSLIIPLGIECKNGGNITFNAETVSLPASCNVILEDKTAKTFTSLDNGNSYTAFVEAGTAGIGRFFLHTSSLSTVTDISSQKTDKSVNAYAIAKVIYITGNNLSGSNASLYDMSGRSINTYKINIDGTVTLDESNLANGVYVLHILNSGKAYSFKVILKD